MEDNSPYVKIANQPSNVVEHVTTIPVGPLAKRETELLLLEYKHNEAANVEAIRSARRFHKRMQKIYDSRKLKTANSN